VRQVGLEAELGIGHVVDDDRHALLELVLELAVERLAEGDATVGQLALPYGVSIQAVSKHLRVLEDAGLVSHSRDAQRRPRHLEAEVFDLMTKWIEKYRQQAEDRFRRLDALLEEMDEPKNPADQRPSAEDQEGAAS